MIDASHRSAQRAGPLRRLAGAWRKRAAGRALAADQSSVQAIIAELATRHPDAVNWSVLDARAGEPSVFLLGRPRAAAEAVLRIAHRPSGRIGLGRAATALETFAALAPPAGVVAGTSVRFPAILGRSADGDRSWLAETALPGVAGSSVLSDRAARRAVLRSSAAAARFIAGMAAETTVVGAAEVGRWVTGRLLAIRPLVSAGGPLAASRAEPLDALAADLSAALTGRAMRIGWIHGDLWPANVLIDPATWQVSGLVDVDSAEPGELLLQDLLHLALTTRRRIERRDLGAVVAELLSGAPWADDDRIVLGPAADEPSEADPAASDLAAFGGLDRSTALWLYWLRAIDINLVRHPELAADRRWVEVNVLRVLACR